MDAPRPHDRPKPRAKRPSDEIWSVLAEVFGEPRTRTEQTMFGKVVKELMDADATATEVVRTCAYVISRFENPSVFAVTKWLSASQVEAPRMSAQEAEIQKLRAVQ